MSPTVSHPDRGVSGDACAKSVTFSPHSGSTHTIVLTWLSSFFKERSREIAYSLRLVAKVYFWGLYWYFLERNKTLVTVTAVVLRLVHSYGSLVIISFSWEPYERYMSISSRVRVTGTSSDWSDAWFSRVRILAAPTATLFFPPDDVIRSCLAQYKYTFVHACQIRIGSCRLHARIADMHLYITTEEQRFSPNSVVSYQMAHTQWSEVPVNVLRAWLHR